MRPVHRILLGGALAAVSIGAALALTQPRPEPFVALVGERPNAPEMQYSCGAHTGELMHYITSDGEEVVLPTGRDC